MTSSRLHLPVLAAILACGPGEPSSSATDADSTSTTTSATAGTTSTTTDATTGPTTGTTPPTSTGTTGDPTTDATTSDTTAGATSTTSTGPDTTSTTGPDTTGPDTTGDASTGAPDLVEFAARYFPGGLDRLVVRKADFGPGLCTSIIFVWPGMAPQGVTLPEQWGVQSAQIGNNIDTCLDLDSPQLPNPVDADSVAGTAAWSSPGCPATLDIDLTLTFPQQQPWVPAMDVVAAMAIPIDGC